MPIETNGSNLDIGGDSAVVHGDNDLKDRLCAELLPSRGGTIPIHEHPVR